MYDDDATITLYELLESNPPEKLRMLPQDIMSINRILGFVGKKQI
jgi:hypothetical protein